MKQRVRPPGSESRPRARTRGAWLRPHPPKTRQAPPTSGRPTEGGRAGARASELEEHEERAAADPSPIHLRGPRRLGPRRRRRRRRRERTPDAFRKRRSRGAAGVRLTASAAACCSTVDARRPAGPAGRAIGCHGRTASPAAASSIDKGSGAERLGWREQQAKVGQGRGRPIFSSPGTRRRRGAGARDASAGGRPRRRPDPVVARASSRPARTCRRTRSPQGCPCCRGGRSR